MRKNIVNIYKANSHTDKVPNILKIREHVEIIRLMIRILHDTKQISLKRMILCKQDDRRNKQAVGWLAKVF